MLIYLLSVTLLWGGLAAFYHVVLRRETFFALNRAYLLVALGLGLLLPLALVYGPAPVSPLFPVQQWWPLSNVAVTPAGTGGPMANDWLSEQSLAWGLYALGVMVNLCFTGMGLWRVASWIHHAERVRDAHGMVHCYTAAVSQPMTFFKWLLLPVHQAYTPDAWQAMLQHERAHARLWHSADVLLLELLLAVCWFHPLVYWYRRALRQVHEYSADAAAAAHSSRQRYGLLLITQAQSGLVPALVHPFFQSPLKQRIMMLTKKRSSRAQRWKYAGLLPLIGLLSWTCQQLQAQSPTENGKKPNALELYEVTHLPEFPGGEQAMLAYLGTHIRYPEKSQHAKVTGKVAILFVIQKDGSIGDVEVVRTPNEEMGEEARRVVETMPKWKPALRGTDPVAVRFTLPIQFKLD